MLTPAQRKAFQDSLATVNTVRPQLEYLERVAQSVPHIADDVSAMRTRLDYLQTMCETCLNVDAELRQSP